MTLSDAAAGTKGKRGWAARPSRLRAQRSARTGYAFLSLWLLGIVFLGAIPILLTFWFSFTNYNLLSPPKFVGLRNYVELAADPNFRDSVLVTTIFVVLTVPLKLALALAVAIALSKPIKGVSVFRILYYLPSLIGTSVAMGIVWRDMFASNGLLNQALAPFGLPNISWTTNPSTSLYTIVLLSVWQFGSPMIIFIAGLKQIPRSYYEAAELDGATSRQKFVHVTIPMLSPIIFFNLVLQLIEAFQSFTPSYVISGGTGGPSNSTLFYSLYLVQTAFRDLQMGYASAMAWVLVLIIGSITAVNFLCARLWVFDEGTER